MFFFFKNFYRKVFFNFLNLKKQKKIKSETLKKIRTDFQVDFNNWGYNPFLSNYKIINRKIINYRAKLSKVLRKKSKFIIKDLYNTYLNKNNFNFFFF